MKSLSSHLPPLDFQTMHGAQKQFFANSLGSLVAAGIGYGIGYFVDYISIDTVLFSIGYCSLDCYIFIWLIQLLYII